MPLRLVEGQYAPGDPICADLITEDQSAAREFYGRAFGWEFEDVEGRMRAVKGRRMAAGLGMMEGLDLAGPRWWLCFAAPNLSAMSRAAGEAISGVMDLEGLGRAAILEDPAGATAVLWQPDKLDPGALGTTHGGLVWSELLTSDPESVAAFYEDLFDVEAIPVGELGQGSGPEGALTLERRELEVRRMVAGIVPAEGAGGGAARGSRWRPYVQVDRLDPFLKSVGTAGALVQSEHRSASGRRTAVVRDPQGAEFGVAEALASQQAEGIET